MAACCSICALLSLTIISLRIRNLVIRRGLAGFSATSENIYQMPDAAADMLFHRAFGKAQLSRGFPLRQALHLAQDEGFAAFGRKLGDGVGDEAKLLALFRLDVGRQMWLKTCWATTSILGASNSPG